jgi:uncharacterized protein YdaU (DUF1376 family)
MRTSQSFPFYHADFLLGTALLSCEQVGAYMRLLCHQWEQGSLPKDENLLAKLAQTSAENIQGILHKFQDAPGGKIKNRKLEEVRKSLNAYRKSRSDNGKKGGRPKKHMVSMCFPDAKAYEKPPTPTPSPIPSPIPTPTANGAHAPQGVAPKPAVGADDQWYAALKINPLYAGIDIDAERSRASAWIAKNHPRRFTRRFFESWLSRADRAINGSIAKPQGRVFTNLATGEKFSPSRNY